METRLGRPPHCLRFPLTGFRAFLLPALFLNLFLCVCLFAQTTNLPLPYPIPPPAAEDPPPAQRSSVSALSSGWIPSRMSKAGFPPDETAPDGSAICFAASFIFFEKDWFAAPFSNSSGEKA